MAICLKHNVTHDGAFGDDCELCVLERQEGRSLPVAEQLVEFTRPDITGVDWANDALFFTHRWSDETSAFDPKGTWNPGGEYYSREYSCRVPLAFQGSDELIERFVEWFSSIFYNTPGFWGDRSEP